MRKGCDAEVFSREKDTKEKIVEKILLEKYNSFYRMAVSYTRNEADAADIVQEGAYRAIRSCRKLKNPEFAYTWVYRIMMNEIYRFTSGIRPDSLDSMDDYVEEGAADRYEDLDLKRVLDSMDPKDKAVIELKYFEEMKIKEIAEVTGENENTVKSRLYRSLRKLRQNLEAEGYDR